MSSFDRLELLYENAANKPSSEFVAAIRTACREGSIHKSDLRSFLDSHIKELSKSCNSLWSQKAELTSSDNEKLALLGQLIASNVIILSEMRSPEAIRENLLLFLEYASLCVKDKYDFFGTAVRVLSYDIKDLGYGWSQIENSTLMNTLAYLICKNMAFDKTKSRKVEYDGNGVVVVENGILSLMSSPEAENGSKAFSVCSDSMEVRTRKSREEKLNESKSADVLAIASFAGNFLSVQKDSGKALPKAGFVLDEDEKVTLKCLPVNKTDADGNPVLECVVLEGKGERGTVVDEELVKGLWTKDIIAFLYDYDCIPDAVVRSADEDDICFSIKESYERYAKETAERDHRDGSVFEAMALTISGRYDRIFWMTVNGYGAVSRLIDGVKVGDIRVMQVCNLQNKDQDLYINIKEATNPDCTNYYAWDQEGVLEDYVLSEADASARVNDSARDEKKEEEMRVFIRRLARILRLTPSPNDSLETYRRLLCSQFLSCVIKEDYGIAAEAADYLRCCLEYAQTGKLDRRDSSIVHPEDKERILDCLSLSDNEVPIYDTASQVDSLLFAERVSSRFKDEFQVTEGAIHRKICQLLGVADQCRKKQATQVYGKYGNGEGHQLEFKSSYVFRNDKQNEKEPNIDYQGRGQVFEAVCGLLNADGGEVYIEVNDKTGNPILGEDCGINGDIKWLSENFDTLKLTKSLLLGHPIPKVDSPDSFVLFLNAEKELYFSETVRSNIIIEATKDLDAIRIKVNPSKFEIAYLYKNSKTHEGGVAYRRDGHRTIMMTDHDKEVRMMNLMDVSKPAKFAVAIQNAINSHHRLIFHNYASGNSGTKQDRHVYPVNLFYNNENVYCWDLEKNDMREFRLARIESIEDDGKQDRISIELKEGKADVFRWVYNGKPKHIRIRMDVGALNYLLEEYSMAGSLPKEELYEESPNKWILDTKIHDFGAIRRFYLGLADKIEILNSEDSKALKEDIASFLKENVICKI